MSYILQMRLDGRPAEWFSWVELTRTSTGLPNEPDEEVRLNLQIVAQCFLDPLRAKVGVPIYITSGYRSPAVNKAVKGSSLSAHLRGCAADFKVKGMTALEVMRVVIEMGLPYDQLIGYAANRGGHVHLGIPVGGYTARRQTLWAPEGGGYHPFDR